MTKVHTDNKETLYNALNLIAELEDQIADIKANCDLAIEGRDIKIKELEQQIEKHKWNDIFLEDCASYDNKIAEEYTTLQERIEKLEKENSELDMKRKAERQIFQGIVEKKNEQLTKAVELLKWALHSDPEHDDLTDFDTKWKETEQFIKEIENGR